VQQVEWRVPEDITGLKFGCTIFSHYPLSVTIGRVRRLGSHYHCPSRRRGFHPKCRPSDTWDRPT
jgi:hypothetical protein